jgi:hypothetical protein
LLLGERTSEPLLWGRLIPREYQVELLGCEDQKQHGI